MEAFKAFNKDMTCRGFQFEEGKEYVEERADLCERGFHACLAPLDTFRYYAPGSSVYHKVELNEVSPERRDDSKVCAKKIKVGAIVGISEMVKAQFEYVKSKTTTEKTGEKLANAGNCGAANAGDYGAANAGNCGAANAGDCGAANAGDCGAANAGDYGAANAGDCGAANAGDCGAAISRGSSAVGKSGVAVARGTEVKAKGGLGSILIIAAEGIDGSIKDWKAAVVDGETIKVDTWYRLRNGELVEA